MPRLRALIAAAGSGTRAGLPYPKTLHPVLGRPILLRLLDLLRPYDAEPVVIVSPAGRPLVESCRSEAGAAAELVEQATPTGMGDAVLLFEAARGHAETEHLLLVWGDIPLLDAETVGGLIKAHFESGADFSFATRRVEQAYTMVKRDSDGRVRDLIETREAGLTPRPGERDIGLFVFRVAPVFSLLRQELAGARGRTTGEHGFLYIVKHLAAQGYRVEAVPIATERDLISLNSLSDLDVLAGEGSAA
jgi:bifunctional UDP-N-acetylglucosamine pyrophosphorylase/glucosamine-1-phosphate N-acetyltransferase